MKPAPPEDIDFRDPDFGWILHSSVEAKRTEIRDPAGATVWSFNEYIGQREIHLSPDGNRLVLFGSQYFGSTLRIDNAVEILRVIEASREPRNIHFDQIFGVGIEIAARRHRDSIKGGGWIASMALCRLERIDWDANLAIFEDDAGNVHNACLRVVS